MKKNLILYEESKTLTVLCIENNADIRLQLSKILKIYFKRVNFCAYADDGLTAFRHVEYDLVITNSYLPDMEADVISSLISSISKVKPVIVLSNNDDDDVNELIKYINIGVRGFIKTPIEEDNVVKILSKVVSEVADKKQLYNFLDQNINNSTVNISSKIILEEEENNTSSENIDSLCMNTDNMSAKELMQEYPMDLDVVGDKLLVLNDRLDIYISRFVHENSSLNALAIASIFEQYSLVLRDMDFFSNIMLATKRLAEVFKSIDNTKSYDDSYYDLIYAMSASLTKWCQEIFITVSSPSIYFMDKSILADVLTIEYAFTDKEEITEEIEFF